MKSGEFQPELPMKPLWSVLLIAALATAAGVGGFHLARSLRSQDGSPAADASVVGKPAPALTLDGVDGERVDLASFRGRTVLLNFWASWCGPCIEEMPVLDAFSKRRAADVTVIGVAVEDHDDARAFLAQFPVSYRIALGSAGSIDESSRFGNRKSLLPYSVLIDAQGIVRRAEARKFEEGDLDAWVNWQQR
jgi:thiol-disulfide isomerase/thioredoxin